MKLKDLGIAVDVQKLKSLVKYDMFADDVSEMWQPDAADGAE